MLKNLNINLDGWRSIYSYYFFFCFNLTFFHSGHTLLHSQQHFVITVTLSKQITSLPPTCHFTAQCSLTVWTSHPTTNVLQPVCQFPDHCIAPPLWLVYHIPTTPISLPCTIYRHLPVQLLVLDCLTPKMGALWFCKMQVKIYHQHGITSQKSWMLTNITNSYNTFKNCFKRENIECVGVAVML
jgi:hypothetical protein